MNETTIRMNDPVCERTVVPTALQPVTWQMNEDPRSWAVNESILFPVRGPVTRGVDSWTNQYCFRSEDPSPEELTRERINTVSCPADWAYAASACHVAREGTAWKLTNHFCFLSCWLSLCSSRLPCGEEGYCMKMTESLTETTRYSRVI